MFEDIHFQKVPGTETSRKVQLLGLSTCGFCRRGQEFLEKHRVAYEFVHLDTLDLETKNGVKQQFKDTFGVSLSYPALVVDGARQTIGYVKRGWEELLDLPPEVDPETVSYLE